jgi:hypothetical protein
MDVSSLESLIRAHPVLSGCVGVYILSATVYLCVEYSRRKKPNKLKEQVNELKRKLKDKENSLHNYSRLLRRLRNPNVRNAYRECHETFIKN